MGKKQNGIYQSAAFHDSAPLPAGTISLGSASAKRRRPRFGVGEIHFRRKRRAERLKGKML
jgi:hypothetical protein